MKEIVNLLPMYWIMPKCSNKFDMLMDTIQLQFLDSCDSKQNPFSEHVMIRTSESSICIP